MFTKNSRIVHTISLYHKNRKDFNIACNGSVWYIYIYVDVINVHLHVYSDVAMLLRDPYALDVLCKTILQCLLQIYEQNKLPRVSCECVIYMCLYSLVTFYAGE